MWRLLVFKHIRNWSYTVCICHRTGRSVTKGWVLASSSAAEPTFALLECADRAQEVDLAPRYQFWDSGARPTAAISGRPTIRTMRPIRRLQSLPLISTTCGCEEVRQ